MQEKHDVPMARQHGENGSNKMITITFDLVKLFFDMQVRHHKMPQFISAIKTLSLWQAFKNICSKRWGQNYLLV
jgi:hypothetical protein